MQQIFCPYTHPQPLGWGQRPNIFLFEVVMLHIKFEGIEHRAPCKPCLTSVLPGNTSDFLNSSLTEVLAKFLFPINNF